MNTCSQLEKCWLKVEICQGGVLEGKRGRVTFNEAGTTSPGPIFFREKLNPPTKDGSTGFWNRWRNYDWGLLSFLATFLPVKLANWEKKAGVVKCCKNGFWVQYGVCLYVPHWKFVNKWPRHPPSKFGAFSPSHWEKRKLRKTLPILSLLLKSRDIISMTNKIKQFCDGVFAFDCLGAFLPLDTKPLGEKPMYAHVDPKFFETWPNTSSGCILLIFMPFGPLCCHRCIVAAQKGLFCLNVALVAPVVPIRSWQ